MSLLLAILISLLRDISFLKLWKYMNNQSDRQKLLEIVNWLLFWGSCLTAILFTGIYFFVALNLTHYPTWQKFLLGLSTSFITISILSMLSYILLRRIKDMRSQTKTEPLSDDIIENIKLELAKKVTLLHGNIIQSMKSELKLSSSSLSINIIENINSEFATNVDFVSDNIIKTMKSEFGNNTKYLCDNIIKTVKSDLITNTELFSDDIIKTVKSELITRNEIFSDDIIKTIKSDLITNTELLSDDIIKGVKSELATNVEFISHDIIKNMKAELADYVEFLANDIIETVKSELRIDAPEKLLNIQNTIKIDQPEADKNSEFEMRNFTRFGRFTYAGDLQVEDFYDVIFHKETEQITTKYSCCMGIHGLFKCNNINDIEDLNEDFEEREIDISLKFPVSHHKGESRNFSIYHFVSNAFAFTKQELLFSLKYLNIESRSWDFFGKIINFPIHELSLWLKFPEEEALGNKTLFVRVETDEGKKNGELSRKLTNSLIKLPEKRLVGFRTKNPLINYRYMLCWFPRPTSDSHGEVSEFIKFLKQNKVIVSGLIKKLIEKISSNDSIEVGMMLLDEKRGALINYTDTDKRYIDFCLAIGEGIAGRAYKLKGIVAWSRDLSVANEGKYYYKKHLGLIHHAVVSIPVFHPNLPEMWKNLNNGRDNNPVAIISFHTFKYGSILAEEVRNLQDGLKLKKDSFISTLETESGDLINKLYKQFNQKIYLLSD